MSRSLPWLMYGLAGLFYAYDTKMSAIHEKDLVAQTTASALAIDAKKEQIEGLKDLIKAKDHIEAVQAGQITALTKENQTLKKEMENSRIYRVSASSEPISQPTE